MAYVGNTPSRGQWRKLTDISASFDGVTTTFTTSVPPGGSQYYVTAGTASQLIISLGGVIQEPDVDYSVSTNSITFTTAPAAGLSFFGVLCGDALNTGVPSDGSITTAKLGGNLTLDLASGSAATPSLTFDANTGVYSPGEDQVAISTNGTGRLFVDSSGNVGVGATPSVRLDVRQNQAAYSYFDYYNTTAGGGVVWRQIVRNIADTGTTSVDFVKYLSGGFAIANNDTNASNFTAFNVGASERMRLDSSGRLGLGTSSVDNKLSVGISAADEGIELKATYNGFRIARFGLVNPGVDNTPYIGSLLGSDFGFITNSVRRMTITADGKVGVGTTSPAGKLDVQGGTIEFDPGVVADSNRAFNFNIAGSNFAKLLVPSGSGGALAFWVGGAGAVSERARIDSSGRLLVGTSSGRNIADAAQGGIQYETTNYGGISITNNRNDVSGATLAFGKQRSGSIGGNTIVQNGDSLGSIIFGGADGTDLESSAASISALIDGTPGANDMPGRLVFSTTADGASSPTEAMRINNGQELLIGYTTDNGVYKLQVNSQIFATSAIIATSDGRYKENVATLEGCVDLVKALRPVSFDWKLQKDITRIDDKGNEILVREGHNFPDGTQVGFIAQEVQEVLADKPWLSSVIKQNVRPAVKDNDGNELAPEEEFLGIAEGNLIAVLTSALQEAIGEIESLKARVAALESA